MPLAFRLGAVIVVLGSGCLEPRESAEPDAGIDASVPDADAGAIEMAQPDAGAWDAGSPEACTPGQPGPAIDCPSDAGATFVRVQQVFDRYCLVCHRPGAKLHSGVDLTSGMAYVNLVGVPSNCDAQLARVQPGRPAESILWLKIDDHACGCGRFRAMPPGADGLRSFPQDFCTIESWIRAGARND